MGRPVQADLDFTSGARIINLVDAAAAQQPATKAQLDASRLGGNVVVITTSGSHAVAAGTTAVILNLASPGSVDLALPTVAAQAKTPIAYADFAGNLTGLTFAADAGDTGGVMGLTGAVTFGGSNGQGPGLAQSGQIVPSAAISGWFTC